MKTIRVLRVYGKAPYAWGIFDVLNNSCCGVFKSQSQAIQKIEDEGWIIQSDMPAILGPDHVATLYERKLKDSTSKEYLRYEC